MLHKLYVTDGGSECHNIDFERTSIQNSVPYNHMPFSTHFLPLPHLTENHYTDLQYFVILQQNSELLYSITNQLDSPYATWHNKIKQMQTTDQAYTVSFPFWFNLSRSTDKDFASLQYCYREDEVTTVSNLLSHFIH